MRWKIIEQSNYEVSDCGIVRNCTTGKIIKQFPTKTSPYAYVGIRLIAGKRVQRSVHRLVAIAFIPNPLNKSQVNHIDKDKTNNLFTNLEWNTPLENMDHHYKTGGKKFNNQVYKGRHGKDHNRSIPIATNGIVFEGISDASRKTGVSSSTIHYSLRKNKPLRNGMHFQLAKI